MRFTLKALIAFAFAACAAIAYADPPGRVGRLSYVSGTVSFAPGELPDEWTQPLLNRPLTAGDRLWVDRDGRGELHIGSTAVRIAPLTSLDVLQLDDERIQLRLAQGTVSVRVRALDADETIEIATPTGAVLLLQPGSYRISADAHSDLARVVVNFGEAEVSMPAQTFLVPPGQAAVVPARGQVAFEIAAPASDEFDRWSAERERRDDHITSTRYVSPGMTGYQDLDQYGSWQAVPQYGAVWIPTRVAPGWAPYRDGRWIWVSPWGWTWVDDAPWGFAPFHYGRWVWVRDYWAWAPGPIVRRPIYAPALVGFIGGPRWAVSIGSGPAVGWFPLGWREPYHPWYRASHTHVRNVNVNVTNVTHIHNVTHAHRHRPDAVTVVAQQTFVSARPVPRARFNVAPADLARAEVMRDKPAAEPVRASFAPERAGQRPPAQAAAREVVAVTAPAARETPSLRESGRSFSRAADPDSRVRVIGSERAARLRGDGTAQQHSRPTTVVPVQPPATTVPESRAAGAAAPAPAGAAAVPARPTPPSTTPIEQQPRTVERRAWRNLPAGANAPAPASAPAASNAPAPASAPAASNAPAPVAPPVTGRGRERSEAESERGARIEAHERVERHRERPQAPARTHTQPATAGAAAAAGALPAAQPQRPELQHRDAARVRAAPAQAQFDRRAAPREPAARPDVPLTREAAAVRAAPMNPGAATQAPRAQPAQPPPRRDPAPGAQRSQQPQREGGVRAQSAPRS